MTAQTLRKSAAELLEAWSPRARDAESVRQSILAFVESEPDACLRRTVAGHITASAVVFSHDHSHVLLTLHPRIGRWVQLGGHCEPADDTVVDAALREAIEESGIEGLSIDPDLFGAQAHGLTCSLGLPTRHLDLNFRLHAPKNAIPVRSAESDDLRWWPVDNLPPGADVILNRM